MPTVSVLIPSFNQGQYIESAVDSILRQSYTDYEIVAVDDGSTDGSLALLERLRSGDPARFRVLTHEGGANEGIVATYDLGIRACRGRYIAFLESDDRWSPDYLARKIPVFEAHPEVGVVFSPCKVVSDGWYGRDMAFRQTVLYRALPKNVPFNNLKNLLRKNNVATFSAFMVRAEIARALSIPRDTRLPFFDWWVLLQISSAARFYFESRSCAYWRQHSGSFIGRQTLHAHKTCLIDFLDLAYAGIHTNLTTLEAPDRSVFERERRKLPLFQAFYRSPSLARFADFFRADPRWALESLASHLVNSWKFADNSRRRDSLRS